MLTNDLLGNDTEYRVLELLRYKNLRPVVSLTSSLRGYLVKCFYDLITKYIFVENMRESS